MTATQAKSEDVRPRLESTVNFKSIFTYSPTDETKCNLRNGKFNDENKKSWSTNHTCWHRSHPRTAKEALCHSQIESTASWTSNNSKWSTIGSRILLNQVRQKALILLNLHSNMTPRPNETSYIESILMEITKQFLLSIQHWCRILHDVNHFSQRKQPVAFLAGRVTRHL